MKLHLDKFADQLASYVRVLSELVERPFVMAIDGRSGAGKSTLAHQLCNRLDALVISGDDFFSGGVTLRHEPPSVLADACINWRMQESVLTSLLDSGVAQYHPFDWSAFDASATLDSVIVEVRPVVILEGVYSARPELRKICDCLVLLEVESGVRNPQLLQREGGIGDWEKQWHRVEDRYFMNLSPREVFDIIVSGEGVERL